MPRSNVVSLTCRGLLIGLLLACTGCGGDPSNSTANAQSAPDAPFTTDDVKDACALITKAMVREATGLPDTTTLKTFTFPLNTDTPNECRYQWNGGNTKTGFGSIHTPKVYSTVSTAQQFFEDKTPTLSKEEMRKRVEGATEAAEEEGDVSAEDAETLQALSDSFTARDSGKSVVWIDVQGIGTRARVQMKGTMSTDYRTAVQYKNVVFRTSAYYGPNSETALPNTSVVEAGASYSAMFKQKTRDRRIKMGKKLAQLVVERLKELE
jgi:hypothetical protein